MDINTYNDKLPAQVNGRGRPVGADAATHIQDVGVSADVAYFDECVWDFPAAMCFVRPTSAAKSKNVG